LIEALAERFNGNKREAAQALDSVLDAVTRRVASGDKVGITGFGTFEKIDRPSRMVRNPRTGEKKRAKKSSVAKFRMGAGLKAAVNGAKKAPAVKKAAAVKTTAAKKTATKSAPAKSAASKSTATKAAAKRAPAKKSAAKAAPAKAMSPVSATSPASAKGSKVEAKKPAATADEKLAAKKAAKKAGAKAKLVSVKAKKFTIDCTEPVEDDIFDIAAFEKFLHERVKVGGKTGVLDNAVTIVREGNVVTVNAKIAFSKRYLKYLTKKFLKKQTLRDYIRVIAKTKAGYHLRYFNFHNDEAAEEETDKKA